MLKDVREHMSIWGERKNQYQEAISQIKTHWMGLTVD